MDDYQFQHQGDAGLETAAKDAVNRTQWLQHWHRHQTDFRNQKLALFFRVFCFALFYIIPWPTHNLPVKAALSVWFYVIIFFGSFLLATWITGKKRINNGSGQEQNRKIERPEWVQTTQQILYYSALIFNLATHFNGWHIWAYLPAALFEFAWDWYEHRILKKDLITWDVLESDGSPRILHNEPIIAKLERSEQSIDQVLGSPSPEPVLIRSSKSQATS